MIDTLTSRLPQTRSSRLGAALVAGVIASELGAILMAIVTCVVYVLGFRLQLLQPFAILAAQRFGPHALWEPTLAQYLWAALAHVSMAAAWGLVYGLFGALLRVDKARWAALLLGVALALAARAVGHDIADAPESLSWAAYLAWALGFAVYPSLFWRLHL